MAAVHSKQHAVHGHRHRHRHPSTLPHFVHLAPIIMRNLMSAFDLTAIQAAAIVGNLGTESQNFTAYHEHGQPDNRGGYGWAQWTGPRRKAFFAWADAKGFRRDSEAASLGFLEHELRTTYRSAISHLKKETELVVATRSFMHRFEGPGIPNEHDRQTHAAVALRAYIQSEPAKRITK